MLMDNDRPQNPIHTAVTHPKAHHHLLTFHTTGITVLFIFIVSQFFFIHLVADAGDMTFASLLDCTNKIRLQYQPNPLFSNDLLDIAAEKKLEDMKKYGYWAHVNPTTGKKPWDLVQEAGYDYEMAGENLAIGFDNSQQICDAWEKSKTHFENITNPTYQEVGFAIDKANLHQNAKGILVVQMFGSRNIEKGSTGSAPPSAAATKPPPPPTDSKPTSPENKKISPPAGEVLGASYGGEMKVNNILFFVIALFFAIGGIGVLYKKAFKKFNTK